MIITLTYGGCGQESTTIVFKTLTAPKITLDELKNYVCHCNLQALFRMKKVNYPLRIAEQTFVLQNHEEALKMTCPCGQRKCYAGYKFLATPICNNDM